MRPKVAASMWTTKPAATPSKEIIPAARPWQMERDTQYIMLGPGVSTSTKAASAKISKSFRGIMVCAFRL